LSIWQTAAVASWLNPKNQTLSNKASYLKAT
jgi:hypothetical protein